MKKGTPEEVAIKHSLNESAKTMIESSKMFYDMAKTWNMKLYFYFKKGECCRFANISNKDAMLYSGRKEDNPGIPEVDQIFVPSNKLGMRLEKIDDMHYKFFIECKDTEKEKSNVINGINSTEWNLRSNKAWDFPVSACAILPDEHGNMSDKRVSWYKIKLYTNE